MNKIIKLCRVYPVLLIAACLFGAVPAVAQQQQQGLCTLVKLEIMQEFALERIGFEATLRLTNNDTDDPITDFSAALTFSNPALSSNGVANDASSMFFVRAPEMEGVANVNGSGIIPPGHTVTIKWFIIPKPGAGGTSALGVKYFVGCNLAGKIRGEFIPDTVLYAIPDAIQVKPDPLLDIAYFQPRDVQGDDPFTETVESPVPFVLGVLVRNVGYGTAHSVYIHSEQPKIVENKQGALLIARLLGVRIMDRALDRSTLKVNIGDIYPGQTRKISWDMITSLSGEFLEFNADYTHAPELGGRETSIITNLTAHFLVHEVINDQAGRDDIKDFLADVDRDADFIADTLYESEGAVLPVNYISNAVAGALNGSTFDVRCDALGAGWSYIRVTDPGQAELPIASVVRDDGKIINSNNVWTSYHYDKQNNKHDYLHIFDLVNSGSNIYTVTYGALGGDTNPPTTSLEFAGYMRQKDGKYYIPPETQMFFISEDAHPVSIFYKIDAGSFIPAFPFRISSNGEYQVSFYAEDSVGNVESTQTVTVVVNSDAPAFSTMTASEDELVLTGDVLAVRPSKTRITFGVVANAMPVDAELDIYRGVLARPVISGIPSSPTDARTVSLTVGGEYTDYYIYRIDGGAWQSERAVTQSLLISNLVDAAHTVDILGRFRDGEYPAENNAVTVSWVVSSNAPPTGISGDVSIPDTNSSAAFTVGGVGVTSYVWTVDGGYYRVEKPVSTPFSISGMMAGSHTVAVRGRVGGILQDITNLTTISWLVDPLYEYDCSTLLKVVSRSYSDIGAAVNFEWDGTGDNGSDVLPGWYTVRIILTDPLGHTNFSTRLIYVDLLEPENTVLADVASGAGQPCGRGSVLLWREQHNGSDQIFADKRDGSSRQVTSGVMNQQSPDTDGRYAVWQGRQTNGNWDVYMADVLSTGAVMRLTATAGSDEVNPVIDWPWVVYQRRAVGAVNDAWQLYALNLQTLQENPIGLTGHDQVHPAIWGGRLVWQDWRDNGPSEIYFKDLESTQAVVRVTDNIYGQGNPAIYNNWIVWEDGRNGQLDLYGYNLLRKQEVRITSTPENETSPYIQGDWIVCLEDSLGADVRNLRLIHIPTLRVIPLTRTSTAKAYPCMSGSDVVWLEQPDSGASIYRSGLPGLQAMFRNMNAVPVTPAMVINYTDSFTLLEQWHDVAGVSEVSRFSSITPTLNKQTAKWSGGLATGDNFPLVSGEFLWINFNAGTVMDLGLTESDSINLPAGISALASTRLPQPFSAYRMIRQLGLSNVHALRVLDGKSGRWLTAEVRDGRIIGYDFPIERSAVILIDMTTEVNGWRPE